MKPGTGISAALWAALSVLLLLLHPGAAGAEGPLYCLRCHQVPVSYLGSLSWQGPVAAERYHPCPGLSRAKEELHQTQSLFFNAGRLLDGRKTSGSSERLLEFMRLRARFRACLNRPLWTMDQITSQLTEIRRDLTDRILRPIWREQADSRIRSLWGWGAALFGLMSLLGFFMHLRHKKKFKGRPVPGKKPPAVGADTRPGGEGGGYEND